MVDSPYLSIAFGAPSRICADLYGFADRRLCYSAIDAYLAEGGLIENQTFRLHLLSGERLRLATSPSSWWWLEGTIPYDPFGHRLLRTACLLFHHSRLLGRSTR